MEDRFTATLRIIMNPQMEEPHCVGAAHISQGTDPLSDNIRVSMPLEYAPEPHRDVLRKHQTQ